ncbi:MAG TPA: putative zinc-binding metallopeptidase, partial [Burkholderiaceae bacterium]|nr:putative zinc-binding metallopeptidase [Burkholderiaceae bacterium]
MSEQLRAAWKPHKHPTAPRAFRCQCGRPVFFRNSQCLACATPLGYDPERAKVLPLKPGPIGGTWQPWHEAGPDNPAYVRCGNFDLGACNWLVPVSPDGHPDATADANSGLVLCRACRLNRTIPDLSVPENVELWRRVEGAKRRLVSQLIALALPVKSLVSEDPEHGLAFDLLRPAPGETVMTGHANGVITLNIEEASDPTRERIREQMHEPYRTLLGHFRHEVGHYYWDRL